MNLGLYVVTDDRLSNGLSHVDIAKRSYDGGADVVQLRVKNGDSRFLEWAKEISQYSKLKNRIFIVNDNLDIAINSGADGVHVGQLDMNVKKIRSIVPKDFLIGVSVKNVDEAMKAESDGASYVSLSPVFDTFSKSDAGSGLGLEMLSEIKRKVNVPVIAIGGINKGNVTDVIKAGADGVAVISAVVSEKDIKSATAEMKSLVDNAIKASEVRR